MSKQSNPTELDFSEYARIDNELQNLQHMSEKHAIEYLLRLMEDDRTGDLEMTQKAATIFVDNCGIVGKMDADGKPFYVPCDPEECPPTNDKQDVYYAKVNNRKMRCVHRDTIPVADNQVQRIGRMVQELDKATKRFDGVRKGDYNPCETARTKDECGSRVSVDANGVERQACSYFSTAEDNDVIREKLWEERKNSGDLATLVYSDKNDLNTTLNGDDDYGVCVPTPTEMQRRVQVFARRMNKLLDEKQLINKRVREMTMANVPDQMQTNVMPFSFMDKNSMMSKKLQVVKDRNQRKKNIQAQIQILRTIIRKYLEVLNRRDTSTQMMLRKDAECRKVMGTYGDCVNVPGCLVLKSDTVEDKLINRAQVIENKQKDEPLRSPQDKLSSVFGTSVCRADDPNKDVLYTETKIDEDTMEKEIPRWLFDALREAEGRDMYDRLRRREKDMSKYMNKDGSPNLNLMQKALMGGAETTRYTDLEIQAPLSINDINYLLNLGSQTYGVTDSLEDMEQCSQKLQADSTSITEVKDKYTQLLFAMKNVCDLANRYHDEYRFVGAFSGETKKDRYEDPSADKTANYNAMTDKKMGKYSSAFQDYQTSLDSNTVIIDSGATLGDGTVTINHSTSNCWSETNKPNKFFFYVRPIKKDEDRACTETGSQAHRDMTKLIFLVIQKSVVLNRLIRRLKNEEDDGGNIDLFLTCCRVKEFMEEYVNKNLLCPPGASGGSACPATAASRLTNVPDFINYLLRNCLNYTICVDSKDDEDGNVISDWEIRDLFIRAIKAEGNKLRHKYEMLNYMQQYLNSNQALVLPGQTVWVHRDMMTLNASKQLETKIFEQLGGNLYSSDWHFVVITDVNWGDDNGTGWTRDLLKLKFDVANTFGQPRDAPRIKAGISSNILLSKGMFTDQNFSANPLSGDNTTNHASGVDANTRQLYFYNPVQDISMEKMTDTDFNKHTTYVYDESISVQNGTLNLLDLWDPGFMKTALIAYALAKKTGDATAVTTVQDLIKKVFKQLGGMFNKPAMVETKTSVAKGKIVLGTSSYNESSKKIEDSNWDGTNTVNSKIKDNELEFNGFKAGETYDNSSDKKIQIDIAAPSYALAQAVQDLYFKIMEMFFTLNNKTLPFRQYLTTRSPNKDKEWAQQAFEPRYSTGSKALSNLLTFSKVNQSGLAAVGVNLNQDPSPNQDISTQSSAILKAELASAIETDQTNKEINEYFSIRVLDLTVLEGLFRFYSCDHDCFPNLPKFTAGDGVKFQTSAGTETKQDKMREFRKKDLFKLRAHRAVNPQGIVDPQSSVVRVVFQGGDRNENDDQVLQEYEVSPFHTGDTLTGATPQTILQHVPHKINREIADTVHSVMTGGATVEFSKVSPFSVSSSEESDDFDSTLAPSFAPSFAPEFSESQDGKTYFTLGSQFTNIEE